ncbi:MAG: RHS repeat-associated core domain-containing protein [Gammaproteobacteria bacterium]
MRERGRERWRYRGPSPAHPLLTNRHHSRRGAWVSHHASTQRNGQRLLPSHRRFLAIDPAGFDPQNPQSFNRYAYANNNPYRFVDPDGNSPLDVGFFIADTVSFGLALYSGNPQAITSADIDLAASAVGLATPIPGTGLAIKAARAAEKIGGVAKGN